MKKNLLFIGAFAIILYSSYAANGATITIPDLKGGTRVISLPPMFPEELVKDIALPAAANAAFERRNYLSRATERHNGQ